MTIFEFLLAVATLTIVGWLVLMSNKVLEEKEKQEEEDEQST